MKKRASKSTSINHQLLYFPYINIPNESWTTRSILYWDKVGAIVPDLYKDNPGRLKKYMRQLVERELVEQVFPYNYIYEARHFEEAFIRLIEQPRFNIDIARDAFKNGDCVEIHVQKLDRLAHYLEQMGLARRNTRQYRWEWYYVESRTARLFMMYLATVIGEVGNYTPATNAAKNIDVSLEQKGLSLYKQRIRGKFLKDLMPYPLSPDLDKLRKFKEKYDTQLKRFRLHLEESVLTVAIIKDTEARGEMYELKKQQILDEKNQIADKLSQSNLGPVVYGTVFRIVGAGLSFVSGNKLAGAFSLSSAVYSAFQGRGKAEMLKRNYAYLALIDQKLTKQPPKK